MKRSRFCSRVKSEVKCLVSIKKMGFGEVCIYVYVLYYGGVYMGFFDYGS